MKLTAHILTEQANIARRATRLFVDGYSIEVNNALSSGAIYMVTSPKGDTYAVDPLIHRCDCEYFKSRNTHLMNDPFAQIIPCKHYAGYQKLLKDQADYDAALVAMCDQWAEEAANAEDAEWGCSPL